ncbi:Streptogrisin-C [Paramyrothecium foliicola]|nr:Streptogrisin-C [Paramyrothecium foliicola]
MELTSFLAILAVVLPFAHGASTRAVTSLHPEILAAMKRDLGLDADQATARVTRDFKATNVIEQLRETAGDSFAGAWIAEDGQTINVGVTDEALAAEVIAAGARPSVFANSLFKLEQAKQALDSLDIEKTKALAHGKDDAGIAAYYIDVAVNKLILEVLAGSTAHAESLASRIGLSKSEFEVHIVEELPSKLALVRAGDPYLINRTARCTIGFAVTTGFVSAGHCGRVGDTATTIGGELLGTFAGSVFPGSADMSYVRTVSGTTFTNVIAGTNIRISGSTPAPVGASICRYGPTTGISCGTVRAVGVTVNYSEGRVTGLTQTNLCAEPGDSGGPIIAGSQAQGVTSGGSGNCASGGTTYFQPVNEILSTYGLTLVRS